MFEINEESYERVQNAIEEVGYCCDTADDYSQWEDVAASAIAPFLEELDEEQLVMTCEAFREYISNTVGEDTNLAMGIRAALERYLRETLDYIGYPDPDEDVAEPDEDDDYYESYKQTNELSKAAFRELTAVRNMEIE